MQNQSKLKDIPFLLGETENSKEPDACTKCCQLIKIQFEPNERLTTLALKSLKSKFANDARNKLDLFPGTAAHSSSCLKVDLVTGRRLMGSLRRQLKYYWAFVVANVCKHVSRRYGATVPLSLPLSLLVVAAAKRINKSI